MRSCHWCAGSLLIAGTIGGVFACTTTSSPSTTGNDVGTDAAAVDGATSHVTDPELLDSGAIPVGNGFTVMDATNTVLNGTYALEIDAFVNGDTTAYNGAYPEIPATDGKPRIEIEAVATTATGAVKRAHFWHYDAAGTSPDKFYGCDGSAALPCTGVTVDVAAKTVTFAHVTWSEVKADLTGATPDSLVQGGGKVTLHGVLKARN